MKLFCIKRPCGKPSRQAFLCQWLQAPRIGNKPRNRERSSGLTLFRSLVASAAILLLLSVPLHAQTVQNPSFEAPMPLPNSYYGVYGMAPIPNWVTTGSACVWQPSTAQFTAIPDGKTVLCMDAGTASQDLGQPPAANTTYTLTVAIGQRLDGLHSTYSLALNAGTTNLCTVTGTNATVPLGTFQDVSASCPVGATPPTGNLNIVLTSDGRQVEFDNVRLTAKSANPPILIKVNLVSKLLWCVICDGTDDTPITGFLVVAQQQTSSTYGLGADGSFAYSVAINVAVDPVDFVFSLLDSAGKPVPGVHLEWIIPQIAIQSAPGWALGTLPLPAMRFARVTDAAGNPAVKFKGFAVGP